MKFSEFNTKFVLILTLLALPLAGIAGHVVETKDKEIQLRMDTAAIHTFSDTVFVKKQEVGKIDTSKKSPAPIKKLSVKSKIRSSPTKTFPITRSSIKQVPRSIPKLKPQPVNQSSTLPEILSKRGKNIPL